MDYKIKLLRLLLILPVVAFILPASAQDKPKQTRTIRILFLNAPPDAPRTVHLHDDLVSQEVELPRMNLSPVYELPAGPLNLRLLAAPVADPKQIPANAPAAEILETMGDAYLLCFSDPANPVVPLRVEVVDAGKDKFPDGMMLWFNFTPHTLDGTLGKETLRIEPHERVLVDAPVAESDSYPVIMSHTIKGDDKAYPICETRWVHDPKNRQLVFVFEEPGKRVLRIFGFADFRPSPPEKTP